MKVKIGHFTSYLHVDFFYLTAKSTIKPVRTTNADKTEKSVGSKPNADPLIWKILLIAGSVIFAGIVVGMCILFTNAKFTFPLGKLNTNQTLKNMNTTLC